MDSGTVIVVLILVIIIIFAIRSSLKHYKGEGGCCGGGGTIRDTKKLDEPKIGEKTAIVEGMHCDNCRNAVEHAVNKIDGAVCRVNLKKKTAKIAYSTEIADEEIVRVIEAAGYKVSKIY